MSAQNCVAKLFALSQSLKGRAVCLLQNLHTFRLYFVVEPLSLDQLHHGRNKIVEPPKIELNLHEGKEKLMKSMICSELQKQLDKPQVWFYKYFPTRIKNVGEREISDRKVIYDFKDGRAFEDVAQRTATAMTERYGLDCGNIVFSPVPASTGEKNEIRYKAFCERVCELTGAINGYGHVSISKERRPLHKNRKQEIHIRKEDNIVFDSAFFDGKSVLVFDDIITKGISYATYAHQLESKGANVIGGVFLARTHYKVV